MISHKIVILIGFSLLLSNSAFSKNIKIEQINPDLEVLQLGAFKKKKNILNKNMENLQVDFFMEKSDNWYRLFAVNIPKSDFKEIEKQIKKEFPTAFKAKYKIIKLLKNRPESASFNTPEIYHDNTGLNTKSILKTRKKFF